MKTFAFAAFAALAFASVACSDDGPDDGAGGDVGPASAGAGGGAGAGGTPLADALTLNDASVLFPLPGGGRLDGLLAASDEGVGGPLVPRELFDRLPDDLLVSEPRAEVYGALRVVGARLDPCAASARRASSTCVAQVRLVLQPVEAGEGGEANARDAAVHAFYDLDGGAFASLLGEVAALKAGASTAGPLGVHPLLQAEGLEGPFARGLRAALLARVGKGRLSRLTSMALSGRANVWIFAGLDVVDGAAVPIDIGGAGVSSQRFVNNSIPATEFSATKIEPAIATDDDFTLYLDSARALAADAAAQRAAYAAALRVENPSLRSPEDVGCVTCHVAGPARLWAERALGLSAEGEADAFSSPLDLTLTSELRDDTTAVRAFGYRGTNVVLSRRTVNETAEAVGRINERFVAP
jgi:hypothetical protein